MSAAPPVPARCSVVADAEGDDRAGTAPPADRWFLVDHAGPWGVRGFAGSDLPPDAVASLSEWARSAGGRVLLIRRHGRRPPVGPRRWFRVDSRPGHEAVRTGVFTDAGELRAAITDPGHAHDDTLTLVCAHGRHDACCAVSGRPLAAELTAADPAGTWECSHVGGCRFAPALVLLPHGYVMGGVPPGAGQDVVRDYRSGTLDTRWLRGRSSLPPAVQAAQQLARTRTGALGVDALGIVEATSDGPRWRVRFTDPSCTVLLRERRVDTGRPLTCSATAPGWMRVFDPE